MDNFSEGSTYVQKVLILYKARKIYISRDFLFEDIALRDFNQMICLLDDPEPVSDFL
jgi:hypothetical protein